MASSSNKEREDIIYESPKSSTSSGDNEPDYEDLRVVAVIKQKNNDAVSLNKSSEKLKIMPTQTISFGGGDKTNVGMKTELILLDEAPRIEQQASGDGHTQKSTITKFHGNNPRVIDLSDDRSKMELRRELKAVTEIGNSVSSAGAARYESRKRNVDVTDRDENDEEDDESADILSRLPPGTILIKQSGNCSAAASATPRTSSREDSDYVHDSSKDSTGTNSSESGSTVSYNATGKVRRMQYRSVRSKKVVQVRRNPVRNKKKKPIDQDFTRPRQRLLSAKRKSSFVIESTGRKRTRNGPTPYMNTRSVTRKMYTVGATYQAPTANDALEWKEWPSHGMHERPVWHPQVGLAYEYNERNFVSSAEAQTYREIIEDPVIEVVSVDPHPERASALSRQRLHYYSALPRRVISGGGTTGGTILDETSEESSFLQRGNSFQACMHGSFHSVLAYCARVVAPTYKNNVDMKISAYSRTDETLLERNSAGGMGELSRNPDEIRIPPSMLVAAAANRSASSVPNEIPVGNFPNAGIRVPKCLVMPRKTINLANIRNIQGNILQEVLNRSSKNTLIFLKPTDAPGKPVEKIAVAGPLECRSSGPRMRRGCNDCPEATVPSVPQRLNNNPMAKLDDSAISDEALMEMSSMYNSLVPSEDIESTSAESSFRGANYASRPPITTTAHLVATKIPVEYQISNETRFSAYRRSNNAIPRGAIEKRITTTANDPTTRFARSSQATEIAKILAEYNEKAADNARSAITNVLGVGGTSPTTPRSDARAGVVRPERGPIDVRPSSSYAVNGRRTIPGKTAFRDVSPASAGAMTFECGDDDNQAMDLTTAGPRHLKRDKIQRPGSAEESNKKWLQDLIEDTATLYCAAAGVNQADVIDYINTLDSVQKMQWLGS